MSELGPKEAAQRAMREANYERTHAAPKRKRPSPVTKPVTTPPSKVTEPVTTAQHVTKPVTPCKECERLKLELMLLTTDVVRLKAALAERGGKTPMTSAEKMRRLRAKRRASEGS